MEEEQILEEFTKVKECQSTNHMDEDEFEAARETCLVLGGKLGAIRRKQDRCYGDTKDLETVIDKEIVACKFEEKELRDMDLTEVRGRTPARQLSPTPLDRHRSQSRERSLSRDYKLPGAKLSQVVSGRQTPDPCAYFSRPSSSLSVYGGRGGRGEDEVDPFRAAMEAEQAEDLSPEPMVMRSATGDLLILLTSDHLLLDPEHDRGGAGVPGHPVPQPRHSYYFCTVPVLNCTLCVLYCTVCTEHVLHLYSSMTQLHSPVRLVVALCRMRPHSCRPYCPPTSAPPSSCGLQATSSTPA